MGFEGWARPQRLRMLFAGTLVLLIAGCGSIGGSDNPEQTPTATVWPTVGNAIDAPSPDASPPWQMAQSPVATAATGTGSVESQDTATPAAALTRVSSSPSAPVVGAATKPAEATPETKVETSPEASVTTLGTAIDTPSTASTTGTPPPSADGNNAPPVVQAANLDTGDGTSGPPPVADLGARTPEPASAGSSPMASPKASPGAGADVIVTNCTPAEIPPAASTSTSYITTSDVNIRVGPGTDCDIAADILPQGTLMTVTSGEVVRDGEEGATWVRVNVDGFEGWVSTEFITPDGQ